MDIIEAARAQGVNVHKEEGMWIVGLSVDAPEPLNVAHPVQATEMLLSGGMIRLANGRELKRKMTEAEARREFGLEPAEA